MVAVNKKSGQPKFRMSYILIVSITFLMSILVVSMVLIIYDQQLVEQYVLAALGIASLVILSLIIFPFIRGLLKKLVEAHEKIELMSTTDELTQLYNRKHFNKLLEIELSRARRYKSCLSCLVLGLDRFKKINEKYGRQYGDQVLQDIAEVLKDNSRITDVIARDDNDMFVCFFPVTDFESTLYLAKRLLALVEVNEFVFEGDTDEIHITASIGVTSCRPSIDKEIDIHKIMNMAGKALEIAKKNGRNRVDYYINN
jgi:diguanylate cyclase (GGDEF)-like protein